MAANPRIRNSSISEASGTDYLEPFIEATISAATRFRRVLLVLIITSVLAFGAFWNARAGSWINSRIDTANEAKKYLDLQTQISFDLKNVEQSMNQAQTGTDVYKNLEAQKQNLEKDQKQVLENMRNTKPHVLRWLEIRNINKTEDLTPVITQLENERSGYRRIHIPFFNNAYDINDLGLLGGFTFVVILMWFRFSLWREYYNLNLAFDEAKDEHLEYCYKAIAIRQVLTVPPTLSGKQPMVKPWGKVVRILYFLPVLIQLVVFINDCYTFPRGWAISEFNTIVGISASLCFLVLSIMLTYWCFQLSSDIDKKWDEVAGFIREKLTQKVADSRLRK
jgi:hypothetical protein